MPLRKFRASAALSIGSVRYHQSINLTDEESAALDAYLSEHPDGKILRSIGAALYRKIEQPFRRKAEMEAQYQTRRSGSRYGAYGNNDGLITFRRCSVSGIFIHIDEPRKPAEQPKEQGEKTDGESTK